MGLTMYASSEMFNQIPRFVDGVILAQLFYLIIIRDRKHYGNKNR